MGYEKIWDLFNLVLKMQNSAEGVSLAEIQRDYGVSRRTAERMRSSLGDCFIQMEEVCSGERTKRWRLPSNHLSTAISFDSAELLALNSAVDYFEQHNLTEKANELASLHTKIQNLMLSNKKRDIEQKTEMLLSFEGFAFRPGPKFKIDSEIIDKLRDALLNNRQVTICYYNRSTQKRSYNTLEPYGILYGERNHYLLARHSDDYYGDEIHYFILTNILSVELLNETYKIANDFDIKEHSKRSFGIFQEEPFVVEWLFSPAVAEEAKRYLFHPTQTAQSNDDGSLTVRFTAGGALEMAWHLYTWGDNVEVIQPEDFWDRV